MQHIFIVGSKGIPGAYGGYETFVDKLTEHHQDNNEIKYHVACKSKEAGEFEYHNARCFQIKVPDIGSMQAIYYDVAALNCCCEYIKSNHIKHPIVYVLACRIGPLSSYFQKRIHNLGGVMWLNPDGHEFLRKKWHPIVRKYWKFSEQLMVKHSDFIICDSKNIKKYIQEEYKKYSPKTTYIAYGSENRSSVLLDKDPKYVQWLKNNGLASHKYYLAVGRFVPENNFETMINEFMKSDTLKDFAIITTANNKFMRRLEKKIQFTEDKRIKFVGTVYDQELLMKIRENAYGYIHGHEVGGTNPSLLEALGSTNLNLLLNVRFNREVSADAAFYWDKGNGYLARLINQMDEMNRDEIYALGLKAKERIQAAYSWDYIGAEYKRVFLSKH